MTASSSTAEDENLQLDDEGFLDLDQSWSALQTMLGSVTTTDLFTEEGLDAAAVAALARVVGPLTWKKAIETCETPEGFDASYVKPYYKGFRSIVLRAAKEGSGLRYEYS